jgi:two-component system response regulator DegU
MNVQDPRPTPVRSGGDADAAPIRVLVALQVPFLRAGVRALLEAEPDLRVVGEVAEADDVLPEMRRLEPSVVLVDTDFQRSRPGFVARLHAARPDTGIVVLVNHADEDCVIRSMLSDPAAPRFSPDAIERLSECCLMALRSSARGCVPKVADPERLLSAIRTVDAGDVAAGPWLGNMLRKNASVSGGLGEERITVRELDIIGLVGRGLENKEIAADLGIAEQTVKNHLSRVMKKLGMRNRQEVALFAVRLHLEEAARAGADG